jgi:hypothetical protein
MWQRRSTIPLSLMLGLAAVPAAAQVEVTVHGGLHLDLASGARYGLERPERPRSARRWAGEATTAGTRVAVELSRGWQLDGGVAWSRSSNWEGAVRALAWWPAWGPRSSCSEAMAPPMPIRPTWEAC